MFVSGGLLTLGWGVARLLGQQGRPTPEQILSLGQLFADTVILPTTLVLFVLELSKHTQEPDVDLYWSTTAKGPGKVLELRLPKESRQPTKARGEVLLRNSGDAIGLWYVLRLWVPVDLLGDRCPQDCWRPLTTDLADWNPAWDSGEEKRRQLLLTFRSEGKVAAYPGDDLILGDLVFWLHRDVINLQKYSLRYRIHTNWGQRQTGDLVVRLREAH